MNEPRNSLVDILGSLVNRVLVPTGLMVTRANPGQAESWRAYIGGPYRSDRRVIRLAREAGHSVSDYLEQQWGRPGRAREIVARMAEAGALRDPLGTILEIGPGAGGCIEAILEISSPRRYEIYEIERQRARWLARTYGVVPLPTSGETLNATRDGSVDLVHAHGVFASLKVIPCFAYFREIARVTAPGGYACFDVIDETCMNEGDVELWLETPLRYVNLLSKPLVVDFFERHGFSLVSEFQLPLLTFGRSTHVVLEKSRV
jgi:hypothetical protein